MKKIEIIDCCNENHKITMMISENCMDFRDDVYHAISKHTGLSETQIAKLEDFRESCKGPFMVPGYQFCDNGADYIASREFDWCDYDVYEAEGYVFIQYNTRVQGDRDCVVKMAKDKYRGLNQAIEDMHEDPEGYYWIGRKVY